MNSGCKSVKPHHQLSSAAFPGMNQEISPAWSGLEKASTRGSRLFQKLLCPCFQGGVTRNSLVQVNIFIGVRSNLFS